MRFFKDSQGREWQVSLWVGNIEAVKEQHGVDLTKLSDPKEVDKLGDYSKLVAVLYTVLEDQITIKSVSPRDFGQGMVGGALSDGLDALVGAVIDFFPPRLAAKAMMEKIAASAAILQAEATREAEQIDPQAIVEAVKSIPSNTATSLPA